MIRRRMGVILLVILALVGTTAARCAAEEIMDNSGYHDVRRDGKDRVLYGTIDGTTCKVRAPIVLSLDGRETYKVTRIEGVNVTSGDLGLKTLVGVRGKDLRFALSEGNRAAKYKCTIEH